MSSQFVKGQQVKVQTSYGSAYDDQIGTVVDGDGAAGSGMWVRFTDDRGQTYLLGFTASELIAADPEPSKFSVGQTVKIRAILGGDETETERVLVGTITAAPTEYADWIVTVDGSDIEYAAADMCPVDPAPIEPTNRFVPDADPTTVQRWANRWAADRDRLSAETARVRSVLGQAIADARRERDSIADLAADLADQLAATTDERDESLAQVARFRNYIKSGVNLIALGAPTIDEDTAIYACELTTDLRRAVRDIRDTANNGDGTTEYRDALTLIAAVRAEIDSVERNVRELIDHTHTYGDDDYCTVCGLDGRS